MNNIKSKILKLFNNKNMKIIIPSIVLFVLLIVVIVYFSIYRYNNYRDKKDIDLYQYFGEQKVEYKATVSYNKKKVIKAFEPHEYKINYESIPIYYNNEEDDNVIFPSQMSIIQPLKKNFQLKIPEFSYIEKANSIHYLTFEDYNKNIDHYIMYDGNDLYFFSDSVSFIINGEEVTLSPLSYVVASLNEFSYYDYESDTYRRYDNKDAIILHNEYYTINVSNDNIEYFGDRLLLTGNFDYLAFLKQES